MAIDQLAKLAKWPLADGPNGHLTPGSWASWRDLGTSCGDLGASWSDLGASWGDLGGSWGYLGATLSSHRGISALLGAILGGSVAKEPVLELMGSIDELMG